MIPTSLDRLLSQQAPLLLQGPMGPFFAKLAKTLREHGQVVRKVNFNGGDEHFYDDAGAVGFHGHPAQWGEFFLDFVARHGIDAIVVFGQSRWMHEEAIRLAKAQGLTVFVFEEGYLRPDYVTLELGGVNAESSIPRDAEFYLNAVLEPMPAPKPTNQLFSVVADMSMTYAWAAWRGKSRYPHYQHHRDLGPVTEGLKWVRGGYRKWRNGVAESAMLPFLSSAAQHKRFFLVPLQVYNDSQIRLHSPFADVAEVIAHVMASFAKHAPDNKLLVFKHHPLDRPYNDYRQLIDQLTQELGVVGRVHYIHDQHLPTLLQHAAGVVTVNSTTGLQSLYHGTPVVTLGDCIYGVPGLVHPGPLAEFWHRPGKVDRVLFNRFRTYLVRETQLNASFYGDTPGLPSYTETSRRWASSMVRPRVEDHSVNWAASTLPKLK